MRSNGGYRDEREMYRRAGGSERVGERERVRVGRPVCEKGAEWGGREREEGVR